MEQMELIDMKLDDDVINKIKDFNHWKLTKEQELLIDDLILNKDLNERYKLYGLCKECNQPNTNNYYLNESIYWCQSCNGKRFKKEKNWKSKNFDIDNIIKRTQLKAKNHKEVLEWIEYGKFKNIIRLAESGYATTYKAIWEDGHIIGWDSENNKWKRWEKNGPVVLKYLHNSQDNMYEFLRGIESYMIANDSDRVIQCYGITKNPKTNEFIMVMKYVKYGSLRKHLDSNFNSLDWVNKLWNLYIIAYGLSKIHNNGLIHRNFHCGNILNDRIEKSLIADGLSLQRDKIYGVLPYVAPEVLRKKRYTRASDIYSFGIIAYEVCMGLPSYHDIAHDETLAIRICQGSRPKSNYKIPQLILDTIKQCWNTDPLERPNAEELVKLFKGLYNDAYLGNKGLINEQIKEADEINFLTESSSSSSTSILSYTTHTRAFYTSRLLDFKNLPKPRNAED